MLKRLQWLKMGTGSTEYLYETVGGCGPNQQWARVWCNLEAYELDKRGASRRKTETSDQFTILLSALGNSGIHIRKLDLTNISLGILRRVLPLRREPYCAQLSTLKSVFLDTSVIYKHRHNTADGHCRVKALGMLLEEAQNLQTLELNGLMRYRPRPYFLQCFRPSLPKLTTLSIFGMAATEQDLINTLIAYPSLDLLRFELADGNYVQSKGSWPQFFRRVPETLPCLLENRLRDPSDCVRVSPSEVRRPSLQTLYIRYAELASSNRIDIPQPLTSF